MGWSAEKAARFEWALKARLGKDGVLNVDRLFLDTAQMGHLERMKQAAKELAKGQKPQLEPEETQEWDKALAAQVRESVGRAKERQRQEGSG